MEIIEITPSKKSTNVLIDQEIKVRIASDYAFDLRPEKTKIIFKINEVDASDSNLYYNLSSDKKALDIVFYPRQRIQYSGLLKYGSTEAHYGNIEGLSESIFEYGASYLVEIKVIQFSETGIIDEIFDKFTFTIEEGVFSNFYPDTYFYSDNTQGLANYLPEWSKARYDKFSNFQQLINPIGIHLEAIDDFANRQRDNLFVQTANLGELATMYKVELNKDFSFSSIENEDGSTSYIQPEIIGTHNITKIDLFTTQENDLANLFYKKQPTRLSSEKQKINENIIFTGSNPNESKIEVNKSLDREGGILLYFEKVNYSIYQNENEKIKIVKCRIYGKSTLDLEQNEDFLLYNERYMASKKMWKTIDSIEFFNIENQNIDFKILHFKDSSISKDVPLPDSKIKTTFENNIEPIFWSLEKRSKSVNAPSDRSILKKQITEGTTYAEILKSAGKTNSIQEYVLLDIKKSNHDVAREINVIDVAPDYYSNNIYAIDNEYLYIYDKREPYPKRLKEIKGDNGGADFVIELDTDELSFNEDGEKEIFFKCLHAIPGKKIVRYRLKIKYPNGTVQYLKENNELTINIADATILVSQNDLLLPDRQYSFSVKDIGEYILELETIYSGGTKSSHSVFFMVPGLYAKAKYKLKKILNSENPISLFFDYDQKLKIFTDNSVLHSINFHKDGVLIDYENKILYFCENYNIIDVEPTVSNSLIESATVLPEYKITGVEIGSEVVDIIYGEQKQLYAFAVYSNGYETITKDITNLASWSSSNALIVSINPKGTITATGVGTPIITVEYDNFSANLPIASSPLLTEIKVTSNAIHLPIGRTMMFIATGYYNNNTTKLLGLSDILWSSSNDSIATIANNGACVALSEGEVTLTATSIISDVSGNKTIIVSPAVVDSIEIEWEEDLR